MRWAKLENYSIGSVAAVNIISICLLHFVYVCVCVSTKYSVFLQIRVISDLITNDYIQYEIMQTEKGKVNRKLQ